MGKRKNAKLRQITPDFSWGLFLAGEWYGKQACPHPRHCGGTGAVGPGAERRLEIPVRERNRTYRRSHDKTQTGAEWGMKMQEKGKIPLFFLRRFVYTKIWFLRGAGYVINDTEKNVTGFSVNAVRKRD